MATELIVKCDQCGDEADHYSVTTPAGTADIDLCAKHAAPLLRLYEKGRPKVAPAPRMGRSQVDLLEGMVRGLPG